MLLGLGSKGVHVWNMAHSLLNIEQYQDKITVNYHSATPSQCGKHRTISTTEDPNG